MQLEKPLVVFDLETTGVDTGKDRILQIGAIKVYPNGKREEKNVLVNPTIPIPKGSSLVHGVYDKDVEDAPTFRQISKSLVGWLAGCDLAGYNSDNFDIPMLVEEFARVGIEFPEEGTKFIDVLKVERKVCGHTLSATYKRYTGEELEGAHDALIDVRATLTILEKQLEKNEELPAISGIDEFCQGDRKRVDFAGKLYEQNGQIYWRFGKHRGELLTETEDYAKWVLGADFSEDTKKHIRKVLEGKEKPE